MRTRSAAIAASMSIGLAMAVLTACGGEEREGESGGGDTGQGPGVTPERRQLVIAENELISRCMRRQGFKHVTEIPPAENVFGTPVEHDDVDARKQNGYGLSDRNPGKEADGIGVNGRYMQTLSKSEQRRWELAYFGGGNSEMQVRLADGSVVTFNRNGCITEARRSLYGDVASYLKVYMIAINYSGKAVGMTERDPGYLEAIAQWRNCMAGRGYHFESPKAAQEAAQDLYTDKDRETARRQEIAIATADAECDRKVNLSKLRRDLLEKNTKLAGKKYEAEILGYQELEQKALKRAKELVGPETLGR
ncbi:hypothetical protein E1200_25325 [Actinomadura sp. GC306]|uniref:hypothetical protein n=1 Tax=Actinomadura sp. GC306 TaxID=2530367 RepID=UPI00104D4FDA|nr:hypothetical protein [Actinomadura sp. GC306]TDC62559.1 hypothetical protein E1200_25325 [Actinomadura sp. GC306]